MVVVKMKKTIMYGLVIFIFAITSLSFSYSSYAQLSGTTVLPTNDGWASYGAGTTGGSTASEANTFVVHNRQEFIEALGGRNNITPRIIYVSGTIDFNVDSDNNPIGRAYFERDGFDMQQYFATYNPDVWGWETPTGQLEEARIASRNAQRDHTMIRFGSNVTVIGLGTDARIKGAHFMVATDSAGNPVRNIIIRNLTFESPLDFFPAWTPDASTQTGEWNSEYDSIQIIHGSENIWVSQNTFTDGTHPDKLYGDVFGFKFEQYDGQVDVTNGSSYITISYNIFENHDKTNLIGSNDNSAALDSGRLKVTFHHNYYRNVGQRLPRVRFGEVHVYNNYYDLTNNTSEFPFSSALGVGFDSHIYANNNYFDLRAGEDTSRILINRNGSNIQENNNFVNGELTDILAVYNLANPNSQLTDTNTWTPTRFNVITPTDSVRDIVRSRAGVSR